MQVQVIGDTSVDKQALFFDCWTYMYISIHITSANICGILKHKLNNCVRALV